MRKESRRSGGWSVVSTVALTVFCVIGSSAIGRANVELTGALAGRIQIVRDQLPQLTRLDLTLTARGEAWRTSLRAASTGGDFFSYLGVSDSRQVGPISFQSLLVFNPSQATFSYFSTLARVELLGIGFADYVYVPAQHDQAYNQITLNGTAGGTRWRSVIRAGLCPGEFEALSIQVDWTWATCGVDLAALASFDNDDGFDRFRLRATYREVPALTFGSLVTDCTVTLELRSDGKTLVPELRTRSAPVSACMTPMLTLELDDDPLSIGSLEVYGVKFECSIGESVEFYAATSMSDARNLELTGDADYFEVYRLGVDLPGCCGGETEVDVAFYFERGSTWLSDWGMTTASIEVPLGRKMLWSLQMEVRAASEWTFYVGWNWQF